MPFPQNTHGLHRPSSSVPPLPPPKSRPLDLDLALQPCQGDREAPAASESPQRRTEIGDVFFGIAASTKLWEQRKNYTKLWFRPEVMKGIVWLDTPVGASGADGSSEENLPPVRISGDTASFAYRNRQGHRSAVRISRIVSEMVRLGAEGVRWFVMGDDDTVFVTDNLVRVMRKYDHNQFYYIGSSLESHLQNIYFSYAMAYGGGGVGQRLENC